MKFSFGIDLHQVTSIIKNTVQQCDELKNDPPPYVGVSVLDPDGYKVMIHAWVEALHHNQLKLQFQKLLVDDLKKAGIKLPGT